MTDIELMSGCPNCGGAWAISSGPGRVVGAIARSLSGVYAPLPDDFAYEYCPSCRHRNMTPELEQRFLGAEAAYRASLTGEGQMGDVGGSRVVGSKGHVAMKPESDLRERAEKVEAYVGVDPSDKDAWRWDAEQLALRPKLTDEWLATLREALVAFDHEVDAAVVRQLERCCRELAASSSQEARPELRDGDHVLVRATVVDTYPDQSEAPMRIDGPAVRVRMAKSDRFATCAEPTVPAGNIERVHRPDNPRVNHTRSAEKDACTVRNQRRQLRELNRCLRVESERRREYQRGILAIASGPESRYGKELAEAVLCDRPIARAATAYVYNPDETRGIALRNAVRGHVKGLNEHDALKAEAERQRLETAPLSSEPSASELRATMCGRCAAVAGTHGRPCIDDGRFMKQLGAWREKVMHEKPSEEA